MEQAAGALVRFGDEVTQTDGSRSGGKLQLAYRDALETFCNLSHDAVLNESDSHSPGTFENDSSSLATTVVGGRGLAQLEATQVGISKSACDASSQGSAIRASAHPVPPAVLQMPLLNSLAFEETPLWGTVVNATTPFWARLLHICLELTCRALRECRLPTSTLSSWLWKTHTFSLRHASPSDLWHLTTIAMRDLAVELHQRKEAGSESPGLTGDSATYFSSTDHHSLARAVRREMEDAKLPLSSMLSAHEIAPYLARKGEVQLSETEIRLRVNVSTYPQAASPRIAVIELQKFMQHLCSGAFCVGDGVSFPKEVVNRAVVSATTKLLEAT
jgi:hypothetical protein